MARVTREDIQHAFERLVNEFGLDKVTMKDLAREAGVSVGAIYLHCEGKDDLIAAYEQRWALHVKLWNRKIIDSDRTPEAKLHDILLDHIEQFSDLIRRKRGVYELLMGAQQLRYLGRRTGDARRMIFQTLAENAAEIMTDGCERGDFAIDDVPRTAGLFVGAFTHFLLPEIVIRHEHEQVVESAEGLYDLLLKAIRSR